MVTLKYVIYAIKIPYQNDYSVRRFMWWLIHRYMLYTLKKIWYVYFLNSFKILMKIPFQRNGCWIMNREAKEQHNSSNGGDLIFSTFLISCSLKKYIKNTTTKKTKILWNRNKDRKTLLVIKCKWLICTTINDTSEFWHFINGISKFFLLSMVFLYYRASYNRNFFF